MKKMLKLKNCGKIYIDLSKMGKMFEKNVQKK